MTDHIDSASSIPLSDPLHSSTTDITTKDSLQITVVRLNANNYLEWTQSVKLAIDGRGKLGYLTGEESVLSQLILPSGSGGVKIHSLLLGC